MMMFSMEKRYLALKQTMSDGMPYEPVVEHEIAFEEFMWAGLDRSKLASSIYQISRNKGEGIGFTGGMFDRHGVSLKRKPNDSIPREDILKGYKHYFGENEVFEENELERSEPETSELQILCESVSKALETQVLSSLESDTPEPHISNKEESKVPELSILNSPEPKNSFVQTLDESEAETSKSEALMKPDKGKMKAKVHGCLKYKQSTAQVLKGSESKTHKSKSLINSEPKYLNDGTKGSSLPKTKLKLRPKNHIPT